MSNVRTPSHRTKLLQGEVSITAYLSEQSLQEDAGCEESQSPVSTLDALRALEEIEASVKALRSLIADVNSYTKYAFWQSCEPYFMNIAEDLERSWDWLEQKMETMRE